MRNVYLHNVDVDVAKELLFRVPLTPKPETIPVIEALDRITAEAVFAARSSPDYNAAAMDGIAAIAARTVGAEPTRPVVLRAGTDFVPIDTGDVIAPPYDCVIMVEDIVEHPDGSASIREAAAPWQHVRPVGEDIVAHEMIVGARHKIRPVDIGALLAGGITEIAVYRKPVVGILPTGTEIVEPGNPLEPGQIVESNSRVFEALCTAYGAQALRHPPLPDDYETLRDTLKTLVSRCDVVVVNAGSSAGRDDYTARLFAELGEVFVHGIATRPGKPTVLGAIDGVPVVGAPGYPVAAYFVFETFVADLIARLLGAPRQERPRVEAVAARRITSSLKHLEFVPVKLGQVGGKRIATPINRGSGVTMSLVRADGLLIIDKNSEGCDAGETMTVELLRDIGQIERTAVSIGSHDLIMDLIADEMQSRGDHFLSSSHVGSMGGLMALKRGEAHIAPIHLLDETSGIYNLAFLRRYLPEEPIALVKGVGRVQGLIVPPGNPKALATIADIASKSASFVNRQRGAGTRLLFDYELKRIGLSPDRITGYEREMTTHMAVAAAVRSGSADCGLGVASAAQALGLAFVPVGNEDYDFAIPARYFDMPAVQAFLAVLRSPDFARRVEALGGYSLEHTGETIDVRPEA